MNKETFNPAKTLAIITARGGSKRIPRKNIRPFHGRPIIEYVISACLESECFTEVMVSTEDAEIASVARQAGASVPFFRSSTNAGDHVGLFEVIREVLETYREKGQIFSEVCALLPTAPFITANKLREARRTLEANPDCTMVLPVVSFCYPIQRAVRIRKNKLSMFQPECFSARSQDLEPAFHDAGQFYYFNGAKLAQMQALSFDGAVPLIYSEREVQDIDNEEDWKMAELKFASLPPS